MKKQKGSMTSMQCQSRFRELTRLFLTFCGNFSCSRLRHKTRVWWPFSQSCLRCVIALLQQDLLDAVDELTALSWYDENNSSFKILRAVPFNAC